MEATKAVSPAEFLEDMFDSPEEKQELKEFLKQRLVVSKLAAIRVAKGVTQVELATQLNCGQSAVSKLEAGVDADVSLSHLHAYAKATGSEVTILMSDRGKTLADQIKMHALSIRQVFLKLVELAHSDDEIAKGVAKLHMQAFENINRMLAETAGKLPPCAENGRPYVQVTSSEDVDDEISTDAPKPLVRKRVAGKAKKKPRELQSA